MKKQCSAYVPKKGAAGTRGANVVLMKVKSLEYQEIEKGMQQVE